MNEESGSSDAVDPFAAELQAVIDRIRAAPFPETNAERLAFLEAHLKDSLAERATTPAPAFVDVEPGSAEALGLSRRMAIAMFEATRPSPHVALDISPCGNAVLQGAAAITIGTAISPLGGVVGLAVGTYLLTQSCGEGDTFLQ